MTPGALLPVREMLADLLLENGAAAEALKEYEAVLETRRAASMPRPAPPRRRTGPATRRKPAPTRCSFSKIANKAETSRPELEWARSYVGRK